MPESVEVTRLKAALEQFKARTPRDLPQSVLRGIEEVEKQLGRVEPVRDTPGAREAQGAATVGTGVHFSKAAKGPDQPSAGQREAAGVAGSKTISEEIQEAASTIAQKVKGGSGD